MEVTSIEAGAVTIEGGEGEPALYANHCSVIFSAEEVILHFALRDFEDPEKADSVMKVATSLPHAKRLAETLARTIGQYEATFGTIVTDVTERVKPEMRERLRRSPSASEKNR
jgi:uncharacterized protein DUF3467